MFPAGGRKNAAKACQEKKKPGNLAWSTLQGDFPSIPRVTFCSGCCISLYSVRCAASVVSSKRSRKFPLFASALPRALIPVGRNCSRCPRRRARGCQGGFPKCPALDFTAACAARGVAQPFAFCSFFGSTLLFLCLRWGCDCGNARQAGVFRPRAVFFFV